MRLTFLLAFAILFSSVSALNFKVQNPYKNIISNFDNAKAAEQILSSRSLLTGGRQTGIEFSTTVCEEEYNSVLQNTNYECLQQVFANRRQDDDQDNNGGGFFDINIFVNQDLTDEQLKYSCSDECFVTVNAALKGLLNTCRNDDAYEGLKTSFGVFLVIPEMACIQYQGKFCIKEADVSGIQMDQINPSNFPESDALEELCTPCAQKLIGAQMKFLKFFIEIFSQFQPEEPERDIDLDVAFEVMMEMFKLSCMRKPDNSFCAPDIKAAFEEEIPESDNPEFFEIICATHRCLPRYFGQFVNLICKHEDVFSSDDPDAVTCDSLSEDLAVFNGPICKKDEEDFCLKKVHNLETEVEIGGLATCEDDDCRCAIVDEVFEYFGDCCASAILNLNANECATAWDQFDDQFPCAWFLNDNCGTNFPQDGSIDEGCPKKENTLKLKFENIKPEFLNAEADFADDECGVTNGKEILECRICLDAEDKFGLFEGSCEASCVNNDDIVECELDLIVDDAENAADMEELMKNAVRTGDVAFESVEEIVDEEYNKNDLEGSAAVSLDDIEVNGSIVEEGAAFATSQVSFAVIIASIIASIFFSN